MQDTFWTPELWCEFINQLPLSGGLLQSEMARFKSSKAPKKEWEIVVYRTTNRNGSNPRFWDLVEGGLYKVRDDYNGSKLGPEHFTDGNIFSVRRLLDASEWHVKEKVDVWETGRFTIETFEISAGRMLVKTDGGTFLLGALQKLPQSILTTVDGVDIFPGDEYYFIDAGWEIRFTGDNYNWVSENIKAFADKEEAILYVQENKPLLSLNDVKKAAGNANTSAKVLNELTALVKQKLNQ